MERFDRPTWAEFWRLLRCGRLRVVRRDTWLFCFGRYWFDGPIYYFNAGVVTFALAEKDHTIFS